MTDSPQQLRTADLPAPPKKKRRWRRRLMLILAGVLALLIVLAAVAPSIASAGPGRRAILRAINGRIQGRIEIDDWSLNWFSGQQIDGLRIVDADATAIAADKLSVPVTLFQVLRGRRDLGNVTADALRADVRFLPDGGTNVERALAARPREKKGEREPKEPAEPQPSPWRVSVRAASLTGTLGGDPIDSPIPFEGTAEVTIDGEWLLVQFTQKARLGDTPAAEVAGTLSFEWSDQPKHPDFVSLTGWADLAAITRHLPRLAGCVGFRKDVRLEAGRATLDNFRVGGFEQTHSLSGRLAIGELTGWHGDQRLAASPVVLAGDAEISPDSFSFPNEGLRLTADWAELEIHGQPRQFHIRTVRRIDLELLFVEAAQFFDTKGYYVGGYASVDASSQEGDAGITAEAAVKVQSLHVWRNGEGILHDRDIRLTLKGLALPESRKLALSQLDIIAADSGLIRLHSSGDYDASGHQPTLSLKGDYAVDASAVKSLLGKNWPNGLAVVSTTQPEPFAATLPLADRKHPRRSTANVLLRGARVEAGAAWKTLSVRGLDIAAPARAVPITLADRKLTVGPSELSANDGTLVVAATIDFAGPGRKPWLGLASTDGKAVQVFHDVRINEQMSTELMPSLHPLFPDARAVSGKMELSLSELHLPLDDKLIGQQGKAAGHFRVNGFRVQGGLLTELSGMLGGLLAGHAGVIDQPIDFRDGRLYFRDSTVEFGGSELFFDGWVSMLDDKLARKLRQDTLKMSITVKLTPNALRQVLSNLLLSRLGLRADLLDLPITVSLHGTRHRYKLDREQFLKELTKYTRQPLSDESID
ncbi:MAG: hypothetical protein PHU85_06710, partial [Phycisphaerae bacterium]|nr:hypothetical protein [Phycisphaerae bacterium]